MESKVNSELTGLEIAVIGMSGRFPLANTIEEFWNILKNGQECISFFSDSDLMEVGVSGDILDNPHLIKAKAILDDIEYFDSHFFDYNAIEAGLMDPQVRIFNEFAWKALEDAGYIPGSDLVRIGVYAGASAHLNWEVLASISGNTDIMGEFNSWLLFDRTFLSTRVSYKLDLSGPSINVQTACSTSLVAIHLACQGILSGECQMALAGGVSVTIPRKSYYLWQEGLFTSSDGHCRGFDKFSSGIVPGEGIGIVVLKYLKQAIADNDNIYAVIKGSAMNNDGKRKVGYTAPSVSGQVSVIRQALRVARVKSESITYVETHGTGTNLGDPTEIEALKQAFNTNKRNFCRIGTVKSNIGHTDCAAGVASFIKVVLSLKHRQIPPTLHFENPNPKIDFENSPFIVNQQLVEWESSNYPLRGGVSSFGIGGTNAHVILEEWKINPSPVVSNNDLSKQNENLNLLNPIDSTRFFQFILLSAKTSSSLDRMTHHLHKCFKEKPNTSLADIAYTLIVGRKAFKHRKMLVVSSIGEAENYLADPSQGKIYNGVVKEENPSVVFMFSGQGSQYVDMAMELYQKEVYFKEQMDQCFEIMMQITNEDIQTVWFSDFHSISSQISSQSKGALDDSQITPITEKFKIANERMYQQDILQPIIFILEYSLAQLLIRWGIKPYAMIGYSIGEYVAACLSGVFSLRDALEIVSLRGKLMHEIPGGTMISVPMSEEQLTKYLKNHRDVSLAVVNGASCIVSGPKDAMEILEDELKKENILGMKLNISHAGHSKMMDPMLEKFHQALQQISYNRPKLPFISTLTGNWITVAQATDPTYWTRHLREAVRFDKGLSKLLNKESGVFIEIGPGRVLSTILMQHPNKTSEHQVINLLKFPNQKVSDLYYLFIRIGHLWLFGVDINWKAFYGEEKRKRISLPTYSFDKHFYTNPSDISLLNKIKTIDKWDGLNSDRNENGIEKGKRSNTGDWFYLPTWKPSPLFLVDPYTWQAEDDKYWLVFMEDLSITELLVNQLKIRHPKIIIVKQGEEFLNHNMEEFILNVKISSHYDYLLRELKSQGKQLGTILHFWNLREENHINCVMERLEDFQNLGYFSLIFLAQALGKLGIINEIQLIVFTNRLYSVFGSPSIYPERATLLGPVKVIPLEYPNISCRNVDIEIPSPDGAEENELVSNILGEIINGNLTDIIAYRGNQRIRRTYEPFYWEKSDAYSKRFKSKGVYLITGGLGGIGLTLAAFLAEHYQARLILCGRSPFPPKENWKQWIEEKGEHDDISEKIKKLQVLEEKKAEIIIYQADVSIESQMKSLIEKAQQKFGQINGVIHCAFHLDGALIHQMTPGITENVFAAKVKGSLILMQLFQNYSLDFFVLCSSLSSLFGNPGEVAYSAANSFIDALASNMPAFQKKNSLPGLNTVSINWDTWREVGGAVATVKRMVDSVLGGKRSSKSIDHPLLGTQKAFQIDQNNCIVFTSQLNPLHNWVLDEHRVNGKSMLPGTAYIEMVRAAFESYSGEKSIQIEKFFLITPLILEDNEEKKVYTILKGREDEFEFQIISKSQASGEKSIWQEHARGRIKTIIAPSPPLQDIIQLKNQYGLIEEEESSVSLESLRLSSSSNSNQSKQSKSEKTEAVVKFGPRWLKNSIKVFRGEGRQLTELELANEFSDDLIEYKLHPALLDCALAQPLLPGICLPFSYNKIVIYDSLPLPSRILSYMTPSENTKLGNLKTKKKMLSFDVIIMDMMGKILLKVVEYTLLEVEQKKTSENRDSIQAKPIVEDGYIIENSQKELIDDQLQNGLLPSEGVEVFTRVLSNNLSQVIISTTDLEARNQSPKKHTFQEVDFNDQIKKIGTPQARPDINTTFVPPQSKTEKILAEIWAKYLGIDGVGIHDNFFDLGANSVSIIQVNQLLNKTLRKELAMVNLYVYPTVKELALFLDEGQEGSKNNDFEIGSTQNIKENHQSRKNKSNKLHQRKKKLRGNKNE